MLKQPTQTYQNIMEILVRDEVQKQLQKQPPNLREYIDPMEGGNLCLKPSSPDVCFFC